jgi:hypothetical protein
MHHPAPVEKEGGGTFAYFGEEPAVDTPFPVFEIDESVGIG